MAYDCWLAPILWQSANIYSPDLPNPNVKSWVMLTVSPGVPLKSGKTYRITIHTIDTPEAPSRWEWYVGGQWVTEPTSASIQCWSIVDSGYAGGSYGIGCNYGAGSGSWTQSGAIDLTFRVYDSEGIQDKQETATNNQIGFQLWNAKSQTFTPLEDYTAVKIELMLNEYETIRRGYFIVKLECVTMGDPGFLWVEDTKLAYTDADGFKRTHEGTDTTANGTAGFIWVETTYLHYIDSSGDERRTEGTKEGATGATAGHIWVELTKLRYIDASGDERYIEGTVSA